MLKKLKKQNHNIDNQNNILNIYYILKITLKKQTGHL